MRNTFTFVLSALCIFLLITSCKKGDNPTLNIYTVDKGIYLSSVQTSAKDTLYVLRTKTSANLRVSANTKNMGVELKRLYVFTRKIDNISSPGAYETYQGSGYAKDANNNYYYKISSENKDSITNDITVALRTNTITAAIDEYYFVYTDDADYAGPASTTGVVIGPAQIFVLYGKLTEYTGIKLYNYATLRTGVYPASDMINQIYKYDTDAAADIDITENTDDAPKFLGKFKARNSTTFVKAPANFPYANATDSEVAYYYSQGTPFTETPDSIKINEVYLVKLRGNANTYAAMKIMYIVPENGKVGDGFDNEYFIFNLKK
ncbi:hypothetical protein [Cytophaga aurantiaca]|uniref:hypothetical protein n=1 Tax=Cytophaga aurantiaca TaxID=29530 RepID=UPI00036DAFF3|nr:hypothetical protein [Cytophaga aurantiaca]